MPDGTVVFPQEPLVRISGPIIQSQILESALLNIFNFQTLIATKAARIKLAAGERPIVDFGLRRAQGIDGSLSASLAAYVGGCSATSNLLAGKLYGIPVQGTHAHSWVMSFDNELEAFQSYAEAMPNNAVFLVDTYDTIDGVKNAIKIGKWLQEHGHKLLGVRLDSGDLAYLSIEARKLLDKAGFRETAIIASNDLDEHIISSLNDQGAQIGVWGVGTKLVTAYDQPALGGVYKLTAVRRPKEPWQYKIKLSEQAAKINNPGILQVRRFVADGVFVGDVIFDVQAPPQGTVVMVDPLDMTRRRRFTKEFACIDLLQPIFRGGKLVYEQPSLQQTKEHAHSQLGCLHAGIKRLLNPHEYPVGLEVSLHELKTSLILKERGFA
jgi:nicotinate phosphoribosyltransferase